MAFVARQRGVASYVKFGLFTGNSCWPRKSSSGSKGSEDTCRLAKLSKLPLSEFMLNYKLAPTRPSGG